RYLLAEPAVVVIALVDPVLPPVVPVTTWLVAAAVLVVKTTVATPPLFVNDVAVANDPPFVLDHVTVWFDVDTELLLASASCAVMVTVLPAATLDELEVTTYFEALPAIVVTALVAPVMPPVVAV